MQYDKNEEVKDFHSRNIITMYYIITVYFHVIILFYVLQRVWKF